MTRTVRRSLQVMVVGLVLFLAALFVAMLRQTLDAWSAFTILGTVATFFGGMASAEIADHHQKARRRR